MDKVSVILPAYNVENYLSRSVHSVLNQSYKNLELIIIDDGSTDGTYSVAKELASGDSRITVIHQHNQGVSAARNVGLRTADGTLVAFIDADDAMKPNYLSTMVSLMSPHVDIAVCGFTTVSRSGKPLFEETPTSGQWGISEWYKTITQLQETKTFNVLWNKIFRMNIIRSNQLVMDVSVNMGEDFLFIVDYLSHMGGDIAVIGCPLYYYSLSPTGLQATANNNATLNRDFEQINHLRALFESKHYPINTIYTTYIRYIYTTVRASNNLKQTVLTIQARKEYQEIRESRIKLGVKYRLFILLINKRLLYLLQIFMYMFEVSRKISKRNWNWR